MKSGVMRVIYLNFGNFHKPSYRIDHGRNKGIMVNSTVIKTLRIFIVVNSNAVKPTSVEKLTVV